MEYVFIGVMWFFTLVDQPLDTTQGCHNTTSEFCKEQKYVAAGKIRKDNN